MHAGGRGAAATQVFILHLLLLHVGSPLHRKASRLIMSVGTYSTLTLFLQVCRTLYIGYSNGPDILYIRL